MVCDGYTDLPRTFLQDRRPRDRPQVDGFGRRLTQVRRNGIKCILLTT